MYDVSWETLKSCSGPCVKIVWEMLIWMRLCKDKLIFGFELQVNVARKKLTYMLKVLKFTQISLILQRLRFFSWHWGQWYWGYLTSCRLGCRVHPIKISEISKSKNRQRQSHFVSGTLRSGFLRNWSSLTLASYLGFKEWIFVIQLI